ncbi:MAG: gliding motility lipoprotein GldH [Bacteroidales bacterium]|nr:gliding motility lipoprotein GldH [Bacteroidales bacterium]
MKRACLIFFIAIAIVSCNSRKLYEEYAEIPDDVWNSKNVLQFNLHMNDTNSAYNIYINVRNDDRYPYSNLYMFVSVHSPDGNSLKDTVEVVLADERGTWLGKGAASIYTVQHLYRSNIRFPLRGIYTFDIEQAMRIEDLRHICNIGLLVEAAGNK